LFGVLSRSLLFCAFLLYVLRGPAVFMFLIFFFQAEDGIRDATVTGVQTCALPIFAQRRKTLGNALAGGLGLASDTVRRGLAAAGIGRASCRERGEIGVGGGGCEKKTVGEKSERITSKRSTAENNRKQSRVDDVYKA